MGTVVNLRPVPSDGAAPPAPGAIPAAARVLVRAPELVELRAFCAAIDLGSIGRAARLMQVSQPALSKRLQALEAVAGTKLLERSTRGVTATPAGAQLHATARRLLADADVVETLMRGLSTHPPPVRVAASPTIAESWLPAALVDLESHHERHLSVELVTANSCLVRQMVRDARSDFGLAAIDPGAPDMGLFETVVWADELVVAVPPAHRWAEVEEIDPGDFVATPMIARDPCANASRVVEATLSAAGLCQVAPLAELGSTAAALATSLATGAPALLPLHAIGEQRDRRLLVRRVAGMRFEREFALVLAGSMQDLTPSARAFAQQLLVWAEH
jgi:DNA-binding transcriptional LysR family regulator